MFNFFSRLAFVSMLFLLSESANALDNCLPETVAKMANLALREGRAFTAPESAALNLCITGKNYVNLDDATIHAYEQIAKKFNSTLKPLVGPETRKAPKNPPTEVKKRSAADSTKF